MPWGTDGPFTEDERKTFALINSLKRQAARWKAAAKRWRKKAKGYRVMLAPHAAWENHEKKEVDDD